MKMKASNERLYFIDWLRVLAMLSIFLYHSSKMFDFDEWNIKNAETSLGASVFVEILDLWMMPLFFVLSGAAVYYSLKVRTVREFVKERSLRIALPWVILGMFIMGPVQVYFERVSSGEFIGTFFRFFPLYFEGFYGLGGNFAWMGIHLWYLMFLFFFSILTIPLWVPLSSGVSLAARLASRIQGLWAILLLALPLFIAAPLADIAGLSILREMGTWDIFSYLLFFVYGFLIFSSPDILNVLQRYRFVLLAGSVISTMVILALEPSAELYFSTLRASSAWFWVLTLLAFSSRYLNSNSRFLSYANEAVLPFYILHQTVIVVLGFYVVQLEMGLLPKLLIVITASFTSIVFIYDWIIKRVGFIRFLFGMRTDTRRLIR